MRGSEEGSRAGVKGREWPILFRNPEQRLMDDISPKGVMIACKNSGLDWLSGGGQVVQLWTSPPLVNFGFCSPSSPASRQTHSMQDVATTELHREIDAWPAAAGPVASEWRPRCQGRKKQDDNNTQNERQGARDREKPAVSPLGSQNCVPGVRAPSADITGALDTRRGTTESRSERSEEGTDVHPDWCQLANARPRDRNAARDGCGGRK
jgi:hypothetical protein